MSFFSFLELLRYSSRKWMWGVCCLMKQNCYFQRGVAECRHAATPLSFYSNNTRLQGFQKRYLTLLYLKGLKRYQQKCYFLRGVAECRHAATPLSSYSINTTHQGFQKRYITLLYLKGLKSYQPSKFKCLPFTPLSLVNRTFHLHFCWYLLSPLRYNKVE